MDWLRSEDLKEEKMLTTSNLTITRHEWIYLSQIELLPFRCVFSPTPLMVDLGLRSKCHVMP